MASPVTLLTLDTLLTLLHLAPNRQEQRESINIFSFFGTYACLKFKQ